MIDQQQFPLAAELIKPEWNDAMFAIGTFIVGNTLVHGKALRKLQKLIQSIYPVQRRKIYRGTRLSIYSLPIIVSGQPVPVKQTRNVRSWTTDRKIASGYHDANMGESASVVLHAMAIPEEVIVDFSDKQILANLVELRTEMEAIRHPHVSQFKSALALIKREAEVMRWVESGSWLLGKDILEIDVIPTTLSQSVINDIVERMDPEDKKQFIRETKEYSAQTTLESDLQGRLKILISYSTVKAWW